MENKRIDNLSDVSAVLEDILQRINILEREIAFLKGESVTEEAVFDDSEAIDLSLDDMTFEEPAASYAEYTPTDIPVGIPVGIPADIPTDIPADIISPDDYIGEPLGAALAEEPAEKPAPAEQPAEEPVDMPAVEPEPIAEPEPEPIAEPEPEPIAEPEPEPQPVEEDMPEDFSNLFGSEFEDVPQDRPKRGRKPSHSILNDTADSSRAVVDMLADRSSWLHDMPGSEVKSLRSAIALGDQVLFIRRLFREDSALYQDTIDKLNSMSTLREAVAYISSTFPEWDTESEDVYRFMMAVRRKIRK